MQNKKYKPGDIVTLYSDKRRWKVRSVNKTEHGVDLVLHHHGRETMHMVEDDREFRQAHEAPF